MSNNQGLEALKEQIKEVIKQNNPEIFALTGKWGVGKTFALRKIIDELRKSNDTKKILDNYAYVSLFGLKEIKEVKFKIAGELIKRPLKKYGTGSFIEKIKQFSSKGTQFFSENAIQTINHFSEKIGIHGAGGLVGGLVEDFVINYTLKDKIICLDDFERTSIDTQEFLGFLQDLKEERNCTIILIYNEEKLEDETKNDFDTYREKVIDKHFAYTPSPTETVDLAFSGAKNDNPFSNIQDYQEFIAEKSESLKLNNIRIVQKILNHLSRDIQPIFEEVHWCSDIYSDIKKDVAEHIISAIILYSVLYFQGDYTGNDLTISKKDFEEYFKFVSLNSKNDEERITKSNQRNWILDFIGSGFSVYSQIQEQPAIQAISQHIIHLITAGYLLENQKNDLKENLEQFNVYKASNMDRDRKYNIWKDITAQRHNQFINNDYPEKFYHAAEDVVAIESINNINYMVNLLKQHHMPAEAQEIIDLFINAHKNHESYDLKNAGRYELDIETMEPDLKHACEKRYQELYKEQQESLEDFCKRRYLDKIYTDSDTTRIKNITKDEMKEFLLGLSKNLKTFGCSLMIPVTIEALYEIYQEGDEARKNQIRCEHIFGKSFKEVYKRESIDAHIKGMIDEILGRQTETEYTNASPPIA